MPNWLITGGCGFIGANFIRELLAGSPAEKVVNLDLLTYAGNPANLKGIAETNYTFVRGDVADPALLERLLDEHRIDRIVNFAAESHVDRSLLEGGAAFIRTNVLGVQTIIDAIRGKPIRFLQVSTDEVYGAIAAGRFPETAPYNPTSPYAASKAAAELLVFAGVKSFGLEAVLTRCSNNYGPYQFPEKLIPLMILNALEDKPLPIYGDGQQVRDWIHVADHCAALRLLMERGRAGEAYNIGGGNERRNLEIVRQILAALGKPEGLIQHIKDRPAHDRRYAVDDTKLTAEFGWAPRVGFAAGLAETIAWYVQNREWWEGVRSGDYRRFYEQWYGGALGSGTPAPGR